MQHSPGALGAPTRRARLALVAALGAVLGLWALGCDDELTGIGQDSRTHPDTLYVANFFDVLEDSVFAIPGSLARSPVGQVGQRFPYTAHILYAFRIPSQVREDNDTLRADELTLSIRGGIDSLSAVPFTGTMRIGLAEVDTGRARDWTRLVFLDSAITSLPPLDGDVAADTLVQGAGLVNDEIQLDFRLLTAQIAGFDSARARGDSIDINVALRFKNFATPGRGFLELPLLNQTRLAQLIVFSDDRANAIATVNPFRSRPVVEFDSTYAPGNNLVASDGYRMHSYLRFAPLSRIFSDSALVFSAELVLTQVDTVDGDGFGLGPSLGVVVPNDTLQVFSEATAQRSIAFSTLATAAPGTPLQIFVTPYIFDIQEGNVANRGMILRLSNEGTKARHLEFYGPAAADSTRRPFLRIVYGYPAGFEGGED